MATLAKLLRHHRCMHLIHQHTGNDLRWADWAAWQLEAAGWRVRVQAWDFVAGYELELGQLGVRLTAPNVANSVGVSTPLSG